MQEPIIFAGKPYVVDDYYRFDQLPSKTKRDSLDQNDDFEVAFGSGARDLTYHLVMMDSEDVMHLLQERYGDNLDSLLRSSEIQDLAKNIERRGLQYPPVGDEGWKRALAVAILGWDLPYFHPVVMLPEAVPVFPSLEGTGTGKGTRSTRGN